MSKDIKVETASETPEVRRYRIKFTGRQLGAIGVTYPITAETQGKDEQDAILSLYEFYDCVHFPQIERL